MPSHLHKKRPRKTVRHSSRPPRARPPVPVTPRGPTRRGGRGRAPRPGCEADPRAHAPLACGGAPCRTPSPPPRARLPPPPYQPLNIRSLRLRHPPGVSHRSSHYQNNYRSSVTAKKADETRQKESLSKRRNKMQRKHTLLCFLPGAFLPSIRTHNQGQSTQNTTLFEMRMYLAESP